MPPSIIIPSKTPTLYDSKKHSQPFLNSDLQKNLHIYSQNESANTSTCRKYTTQSKVVQDNNNNNRSRTAIQSRLQKASVTLDHVVGNLTKGPSMEPLHHPQPMLMAHAYNGNDCGGKSQSVFSKTGYGSQASITPAK